MSTCRIPLTKDGLTLYVPDERGRSYKDARILAWLTTIEPVRNLRNGSSILDGPIFTINRTPLMNSVVPDQEVDDGKGGWIS